MGWQRRMAAQPGPLAASGVASNGDPVQVELYIDGTWVDITAYVMTRDGSERISITRGRRDEGATQAEHSTCSFQLNNRDGRFSHRNPNSPYYGKLGRNQPLRVSVPGPTGSKAYRFWGEISAWPQSWDTTGTDIWTDVEAAGIIRRLSQGSAPTRSVIYDAITHPSVSNLLAYWPCEDIADSTVIATAVTNGSDGTISGTPGLASVDRFGASDPLPDWTDATFTGGVARYDTPTATQVRFLLYLPPDGVDDGQVICTIRQDSAALRYWELYYGTGGTLALRALDGDGATLAGGVAASGDVRGKPLRVSVELQQNGADIDCAVRFINTVTGVSESATGTQNAATLARVTSIAICPAQVLGSATRGLTDGTAGHVTLQNEITAMTDLGESLDPSGETAGRRIARLCAEDGIAFDAVGDLDDTPAMGAQDKSKPVDLMRECELVDGGMLVENLARLGLGYRTRVSLYNQDAALTLSYPDGQLSEVPTPVDDDQLVRNRVTVTIGGISTVAELDDGPMSTEDPPAGIGVYGEDVTLNLLDTADGEDQAAWRLHLGTVDEARYPQISVNLAHPQFTGNPALRAAVLDLRQGDRMLVADPPSWLPPDDIDQLTLGFSETITWFEHRLTLTCAPASPYRVGTLDDNTGFRIDTDGSELYADIDTTSTSIDVIPSAGQTGHLWTTDTSETPWDILVGGETMTVTAVASKGHDAFGRTETNTWGTADSGQAWTEENGDASDRSVAGGVGILTLASSTTTIRRQLLLSDIRDCEMLVSISPGQVSTGNSLVPGLILRYADSGAYYRCRLHFRTDSGVYLVVLNSVTQIGDQVDTGLTYSANDVFWLRARVDGHRIRGRAWAATGAEPAEWHIDRTLTSNLVDSGMVGVTASSLSGLTNVNPTVSYDSFAVVDPQTFTVTRSVNGISKAHTAGTDVRLADPTILAL